MKEEILRILQDILKEDGITIRGIYERSDAKVRLQEGMERKTGFLSQPFDTKVPIVENGVKYLVDVAEGQKTGFFLDQKYNRLAIHRLCRGARVLDCFTHTGSFALNAGIAGAREVLGVDASELACEQGQENARLNGLEDRVKFQCEDVFELLPRLEKENQLFDVVILDPPAFTKSRNSIKNAVKGYREINLRAMKLVRPGGFLATCSAPTSWTTSCLPRPSARQPRTSTSGCARWNSAPRRRIIRSCGRRTSLLSQVLYFSGV